MILLMLAFITKAHWLKDEVVKALSLFKRFFAHLQSEKEITEDEKRQASLTRVINALEHYPRLLYYSSWLLVNYLVYGTASLWVQSEDKHIAALLRSVAKLLAAFFGVEISNEDFHFVRPALVPICDWVTSICEETNLTQFTPVYNGQYSKEVTQRWILLVLTKDQSWLDTHSICTPKSLRKKNKERKYYRMKQEHGINLTVVHPDGKEEHLVKRDQKCKKPKNFTTRTIKVPVDLKMVLIGMSYITKEEEREKKRKKLLKEHPHLLLEPLADCGFPSVLSDMVSSVLF
jgi:hypothetical protein